MGLCICLRPKRGYRLIDGRQGIYQRNSELESREFRVAREVRLALFGQDAERAESRAGAIRPLVRRDRRERTCP